MFRFGFLKNRFLISCWVIVEPPWSIPPCSPSTLPVGFFGASFALDPEQALGGQIRAGDHVAIVGTIASNGTDPETSSVIASNVLVTSVQIDGKSGDNPKRKEVTAAPTGKFFVTFALTEGDLGKVVASANTGRMWLAENPQAGPTQ